MHIEKKRMDDEKLRTLLAATLQRLTPINPGGDVAVIGELLGDIAWRTDNIRELAIEVAAKEATLQAGRGAILAYSERTNALYKELATKNTELQLAEATILEHSKEIDALERTAQICGARITTLEKKLGIGG